MDRVMTSLRHRQYNGEGTIWKYMVVSFLGHLLVMGFFLYWPTQKGERIYIPEVINVRMVTLPEPKAGPPQPKPKTVSRKPRPDVAKPQIKPDAVGLGKKKVKPVKTKTKVSLKHKTFKSKKVLRNAIRELERKVETAPPEPLAETLKRLKEKVASEKAPPRQTEVRVGEKRGVNTTSFGIGKGKGKTVSDLLTIYRVEIAYQVQKHWAFSPELAGASGNLTTGVIFKVLPDGEITDIIITDHSGNAYLDESARKAILKSSPVSPHPAGLNMPYVTVGLRFTPEGVR